jgi:ubiquinone/menaquinone biosynthesis C-methylase UbiE
MRDVFDAHAKTYSEDIDAVLGRYGANHDFFTQHKASLIQDLLLERFFDPAAVHLLDVGCGVAKIHEYFRGKYNGVSGVDVSENSLDIAKVNYPEFNYSVYDGQRLPLGDKSVDVTIAICVFHHVPPEQWQELANEMLRVLRPGGISIVIEHNPYNPLTRHIVNTCPLDEGVVLLSPSTLRKLFSLHNQTKVETRTILTIPAKTKFLRTIDKVLGNLPFGTQYYLVTEKNL